MAFTKGHTPWNKGKMGRKPWMNLDGLIYGRGFCNPKGTSKSQSYNAIHWWVNQNKEKTHICENCGKYNKHTEMANKDHLYKKNINDYQELCKKCHTKYDYENHLSNKGSRWGSIKNKVEVANV